MLNRDMKTLSVLLAVLCIVTGCATTRPPDLSPAEQEYVIDEQYLRGVNAANEDMRGSGPYGALLLVSIPLYLSEEPVMRGAGMLFGATALTMGLRRRQNDPDSVPRSRLRGLTEEEQDSFSRGYMNQLQARDSENTKTATLVSGLSVIVVYFLFRGLFVPQYD